MEMNDDERRRYITLMEATEDVPTKRTILDQLYATPRKLEVPMAVRIVDPLLELIGIKTPGDEPNMNRYVTEMVLDSLDSAWYDAHEGASWWIDGYRTTGIANHGHWAPIGDGGPQGPPEPAQATNSSLSFASVDEALGWAREYLAANADDVRELIG